VTRAAIYGARMRWVLLLLVACHATTTHVQPDGTPAADATGYVRSTLTAESAPNTSASPLFVDDYHNYNTTSQTGNSNGDLPYGAAISTVPFTGNVLVETQTWFCHLASNEAGSRVAANARCGSHIDVGYNSDDPDHVAAAVAALQARGVRGVIMDWSGKDTSHDGSAAFYPTGTSHDTTHARGSTEVATNAIFATRTAAEQTPGFSFAVVEDEGITNCRKGWAGGCACWPAYGSACNETTQVISDLSYIRAHWANSPAYLQLDGKPAVLFFAPDYNACPDPTKPDCQHIDWNAVHQFVGGQTWIFEHAGGYTHAFSGGAFAWPSPTLYPGHDTTYAVGGIASFDQAHVPAGEHVVTSAAKGFDDGVTDGWNYQDGTNTRYIAQRCGLTWLDMLDQIATDFSGGAEMIQLVTFDDYEEATELETGIDTCLQQLTAQVTGTQLTWSTRYGSDLTGAASGDERTIDHVVVWASPDGEQLEQIAVVAPDVHTIDLPPLPADAAMLYVQAVGKPLLTNAFSAAIPLR